MLQTDGRGEGSFRPIHVTARADSKLSGRKKNSMEDFKVGCAHRVRFLGEGGESSCLSWSGIHDAKGGKIRPIVKGDKRDSEALKGV